MSERVDSCILAPPEQLTITDEAMKDKELLEDLVRSAINQAIQKAKQAVAAETSKMAQGMGLPAGMQLPT